jgi:hypothetical protein
VEIPAVMIETRTEGMVDEFGQRLRFQGLSLEQYLQFSNLSRDQLKQQFLGSGGTGGQNQSGHGGNRQGRAGPGYRRGFRQEVAKAAEQYKREPRKCVKPWKDSAVPWKSALNWIKWPKSWWTIQSDHPGSFPGGLKQGFEPEEEKSEPAAE